MSESSDHRGPPPAVDESEHNRHVSPGIGETQSFVGETDQLPTDPMTVPPVAGRYQVKRFLGRGSFGAVYEGWDNSLQRSVAIKVLTTDKVPQRKVQEWLHEARTLAALDHPGVVPVYDLGQDRDGRPFIVSKFVAGGNLASRLAQGPVSHQEAVRLTTAVAEALDYAHRQKVVHRDVKPANILLGDNGEPVLADFGVAIHESEFGTGARFVGTPAYMSPEQARSEGHRVDGRTDIYSLGIVFYELLTGTRPFQAENVKELLDCVRHVEVRPPRQILREIPKELERICLKALSKRANDRYGVASDLAEELSAWLASIASSDAATAAESAATSPSGSVQSHESMGVSIIPRGLRPFNAADADFFLHLLPGPRDRDGLPESVRFWKTQIEHHDPGEAFRVGAILGPSGSGKSSLVRAGILPHLDPSIIVLLIEARPDGFELALHKRLRQLLPELDSTESLTEALQHFRQSRTSAGGPRLLLVIDQFEQWLSQHGGEQTNAILEALRQCDGSALQAMLLVRDDFTLALAGFMDQLEEPLLQNHNFAVVDFFGTEHAQKVLAAFGRAYATVDDPTTREQKRFLELAIDELETNGRVVPVQLALFADMVKEQPWTPGVLRDFGGARGVGVAFLDDRLRGRNAHPEFRSHPVLIQRLLASLLPAEGVEVRPPARSWSELVTPLLNVASEETIERLLGLLDSELRIVTPSASSETGSAHTDSSIQDPAFQLTHDYLVPSIRQWLDAEERSTRRGRVAIRLRELSQAWNAKPEPRRLPSWVEWLTIQMWTRRRDWNAAQRRMMRSADLRVTATVLFICVAAVALWFSGRNVVERWRVEALAEQIVNADVGEIAGIVSSIDSGSSAVAERLEQVALELDALFTNTSPHDDPVQIDRRRLNIALVLAADKPAQAGRLIDLLPTVEVNDLVGVRRAWPPQAPDLQEKLWLRFERAAADQRESLLPFGAILAHGIPDDPRWPNYVRSIVEQLATSRTVYIRDWIGHFQPLAKLLGPELVRQLRSTSSLSDVARSNLLEAVIAYCPGHPEVVAATVASIRIEEFDSLVAAIDTADPNLRAELRREFTDVARTLSHQPSEDPLTAEVAALNEAAAAKGGFADAKTAMALSLSQSDFADFSRQMTNAGYSPTSIRPYGDHHQRQVATVWRRTNLPSRVEWDLTGEAANDRDKSAASDGLWMEDFAWYPRNESESEERRLVCLWVANGEGIETRSYFDRSSKEHDDFESTWDDEGFTLHRYAERINEVGVRLHSAIWRKTSDEKAESSSFHRFRRYFGDHEPGLRQTDLRLTDFALPMPDRINLYNDWRYYEDELPALKDQKRIDNNRLFAAKRLSAMGRLDEAKAILLALLPRKESNSTFCENLAVLYARMGLAKEFQRPLDTYCGSRYAKPHIVRYLTLLAAVLARNVAEATTALSQLEAAQENSAADFEVYLRGLALAASHPALAETATTTRQTLRAMLTRKRQDDSSMLLQEIDFDALRNDPEIGQLLFEQGLSQLVTGTYREDATIETRYLLSLPTTEHAMAVEKLRQGGYLPVTLEVHAESSEGPMYLTSVWERQIMPIASRINAARARAKLAMILARVGEDDLYVEGMSGNWGSDMQSHLILESSSVVPAKKLIENLRTAKNEELQRALLLAAGSYDPATIPANDLSYLRSRVGSWAASAGSAGVRQAACWFLTKWGQPLPASELRPSAASSDGPTKHLDWFTNSIDQTLVVLRPPDRFLAGSPYWDLNRKPGKDESQYWIQIGRTFAIAATETTIEQFTQFLSDPRVQPVYKEKPFTYPARATMGANSPQISVSWLDAIRFCQWLSEKEGLPEDQWCYPGVLTLGGETIQLPENYRQRCGYRLPTEAEWEYAAGGGSPATRHCGDDPRLLDGFEWSKENSGGVSHPVARMRPNPFGLFDTLGNVFEWSDSLFKRKRTSRFTYVLADDDALSTIPPSKLVLGRGGRYSYSLNSARTDERRDAHDDFRSATSGFRIARTIRLQP